MICSKDAKRVQRRMRAPLLDGHPVLVDLHMPGEDGWWFMRELRASRTPSAQVAVFAMSGERHEQLDPATGFAGYFFKPVDLDALVSVLSALPRRSR